MYMYVRLYICTHVTWLSRLSHNAETTLLDTDRENQRTTVVCINLTGSSLEPYSSSPYLTRAVCLYPRVVFTADSKVPYFGRKS